MSSQSALSPLSAAEVPAKTAAQSIYTAQLPATFQPRLTCSVCIHAEHLLMVQGDQEIHFPAWRLMPKLLQFMDGHHSLKALQERFFPQHPEILDRFLAQLYEYGLIQDGQPAITDGTHCYQTLQEIAQVLLHQSQQISQFWDSMTEDPVPQVLYGYAIETYQIMARLSEFCTPALGVQGFPQIQQHLQNWYSQTYGQARYLLAALEAAGFEAENLNQRPPLPYTMAICQSLNFWARSDRTLFLNALGLWWQHLQTQLPIFVQACNKAGLPSGFVAALECLIQAQQQSPLDVESCFAAIAHIEARHQNQLRGQTHLWVETHQQFYQTLWDHYSSVHTQ